MGFLAAGMLVAGSGPALADDDADKAHKAAQRAEAILENATDQAQKAAQAYEEATSQLPAAQTRLAVTRGLVAAAVTDANTARRAADTARAAYDVVAAKYETAQTHVDAARDRVDTIATASYMGSTFSRLNVLADAAGPRDLMDRFSMIYQLMKTQQRDVDSMLAARRIVRTAQDQAGLAQRTAEVAEGDAQDKLDTAKQAQADALKAKQDLARLAADRLTALHLAQAQRSAVLAKYEQAREDEERIRAALRGYSVRSGPARYLGGQLLMPVDGWKSSDFGERYDPFYKVWQLHAGTDFAAPEGTPIHAAADGRVVWAGWKGGYGNYTCLDHGRMGGVGFMTCYGHQSRILVDVGEWVQRGEVIGRVGTTGASTGDHLHFETRFDGVPRNPLPYLPSCLC